MKPTVIEKVKKEENFMDFIDRHSNEINALYGADMKWTSIFERIKMRAPITPDEKDYFFDKLNET